MSADVTLPNARQFVDLVQRADAYILALRQVVYSKRPEVRRIASEHLNELGSCWYAARESCASTVLEGKYCG
jgi:hypothetical protein